MDDVAGGDGVSGVDFSDKIETFRWLEKQPVSKRCVIAVRAALRVFPYVIEIPTSEISQIALQVLRSILTTMVYSRGLSSDIGWYRAVAPTLANETFGAARLAYSLTTAANSSDAQATRLAILAAAHAANSMISSNLSSHSPDAASQSIISANRAAANSTKKSSTTIESLLTVSATAADSVIPHPKLHSEATWTRGGAPIEINSKHQKFLSFFKDDLDTWGFWHSVYIDLWEGQFTDWDLALDVVKIPDGVWKTGAEAVAVEIEQIKARRLGDALPQAERIEFNSEDHTFSAFPVALAKPDLIGATLQQVEDSLEDVMASPSNGLSENSREVRVITRTIQKYGNNPQQIEMGFVSAHAGMTRQMVVGDLPPSEENLALQTALEEGAVAIRATHPDVAENRAILTKRKFAELSPEQKEQLSDALPILIAISDQALADDWNHDIPALINTSMGPLPTGAPPLLGADEATRIFSRAAKISILLRTGDIIHQIDQSAAYKGARIVVTVGGLVSLGLALLVLI